MAVKPSKTPRPSPAAAAPAAPPPTYSRLRRLLSLINLAAIIFLSFYIVLVFNLIIYRHPWRLDFTAESLHTLSGETRALLERVQGEVRVVVPFIFQEGNPTHRIQREIFVRARGLLNEYIALQPNIRIEAELNLADSEDAARWEALRQRRGLAESQFNCFLFFAGDGMTGEGAGGDDGAGAGGEEFRQVVAIDELAIYDKPASRLDPKPPRIHEFLGEQAFTSAIVRLIRRERIKVYLTRDWGEPSARDAREGGLSRFREEFEANGYEIAELPLLREKRVPADCELLVIVSPTRPIEASDRQPIHDYLLGGGRLLAALGPAETGLEALLEEWGVRVPPGQVLQQAIGQYWSNLVAARDFNPLHPITKSFARGAFEAAGVHARPIDPTLKDDLAPEFLIKSDPRLKAFVDSNRNRALDDGEPQGPAILAAAVLRQRPDRPPPDWKPLPTRLAVFGDSTFLTNAWFDRYSHRDLALNTARWLLAREAEIGVSSARWVDRRIPSTPEIHRFLFWTTIFLFPGIVLCLGASVYFLRRA